MNPERLKQIDENAIKGELPDAFTVQAMCAEIRILTRTIASQRSVLLELRQELDRANLERDARYLSRVARGS